MPQRRFYLDTETTGFKYNQGDRVIEIGVVEAIDNVRTGREFHCLLNPDRDIDADSTRVHGHTRESLQNERRFADVMHEFIAFIEGGEVVVHNADFDANFLNAELKRASYPKTIWEICDFTDSLATARRVAPGLKNHKLDTLLAHYGVDSSSRTLHGAIIDARLLADLYITMDRQHDLSRPSIEVDRPRSEVSFIDRTSLPALPRIAVSEEAQARHEKYLDGMGAPPVARASRSPSMRV